MGGDDINNLQETAAGKAKNAFHILAMPYPAKGHSNPVMNLCKLIASKRPDILITFVTEEGAYPTTSADGYPPNITFVYLPNNILPSAEAHKADMFSFGMAVRTKLGAPFQEILDSFDQTPVTTIIADMNLPWAVEAANQRNIPVAVFWVTTVTEFSIQCHLNLFKEKQFSTDLEEHANDVVDFIPGISPMRVSDLPRFFLESGQSVAMDTWNIELPISNIQYLLVPSIYDLESHVFDSLGQKLNFPIYPFGPLIPFFELNKDNNPTETPPDYIQWLDSQPASSVLYIAMGSVRSLSSRQMEEMAAGLRSSGVRYLWVGRENSRQLKELCGGCELGMVVPWCDQMRVLRHLSVGGFLTHCGLSSIFEAGFFGVPFLTFPIAGDQFPICKLVVEDWRVGWRLRKEIGGNKLIAGEEIAETVEKFMDINGGERGELSERAREFQAILRGAAAKGGSSDANIDAFIKDITQGQHA